MTIILEPSTFSTWENDSEHFTWKRFDKNLLQLQHGENEGTLLKNLLARFGRCKAGYTSKNSVWKNTVFMVRSCCLITPIKCLKGHKSLGSLLKGGTLKVSPTYQRSNHLTTGVGARDAKNAFCKIASWTKLVWIQMENWRGYNQVKECIEISKSPNWTFFVVQNGPQHSSTFDGLSIQKHVLGVREHNSRLFKIMIHKKAQQFDPLCSPSNLPGRGFYCQTDLWWKWDLAGCRAE